MNTALKTLRYALTLAIAAACATPAMSSEVTRAPEFENYVPQLTREQVRAELLTVTAQRRMAHNEADALQPAETVSHPAKTRAQVKAETLEALRLGLIPFNSTQAGLPTPSPEQLTRIEQAGLRALQIHIAQP